LAAVTLVAFGISDYAEIRTGGEWWRPWWLLAWKATCVVTLMSLLLVARRAKGSHVASTLVSPSSP
jgi:hypothetical protein